MVVPININNIHWTSVHVDFPNQTILYYDSLFNPDPRRGDGKKYMDIVYNYLRDEWNRIYGDKKHVPAFDSNRDWQKWDLEDTVPQQIEDDCAIFTIMFCLYRTDMSVRNRLAFHFDHTNMRDLRKRLVADVLNGNIE